MKPVNCPACHKNMTITKLYCPTCDITVKGSFSSDRNMMIDDEVHKFIETFILMRGNIKEIEKHLGISYPTVKSKIDKMVAEVQRIKKMEEEHSKEQKKEQEARKRSDEKVRKITMDQ